MLQRNLPPSHPGEILREMFINEHSLTITEVAAGLGVSTVNLSALVNERAGISPELAIKLSKAFGNTLSSGLIFRRIMNYGMRKKK